MRIDISLGFADIEPYDFALANARHAESCMCSFAPLTDRRPGGVGRLREPHPEYREACFARDEALELQAEQLLGDGPDSAELYIGEHRLTATRRLVDGCVSYVISGEAYAARAALIAIGCDWDSGIKRFVSPDWLRLRRFAFDCRNFG